MGSSSDVSSSVSTRVREWAVAHATGGAQHNWLWREHVQLELLEVEGASRVGHRRGSGKARWTGSEQNGSAPRGWRQSATTRWRERRRLVSQDGQEGSRISGLRVVTGSFLLATKAERCVATTQAEVRVSPTPLDAQHAHHVAGLVVVRQPSVVRHGVSLAPH
jgi:hypothetical protein